MPPCGQLDPTLDLTQQVLEGIYFDTERLFSSSYIHLGGNDVNFNCWDSRPAIRQWMQRHSIADYYQLYAHFLKVQRQAISAAKQKIVWFNRDSLRVKFDESDILQYWDSKFSEFYISPKKNKIILSPSDALFLNCGAEDIFGQKQE